MPEIIKSPANPAPFLEILSDAAEIQVDEVIAPPKQTTDGYYTYYVKVKPKEAPKPIEAPKVANEKSPLTDEYLFKNAEVLIQAEDFLLAKNIYSALLERNIRDSRALMGLGRCLLKLGHQASARKCFSAVNELYSDPAAKLAIALCCSEQEEDEEAVALFENVDANALKTTDRFEMYKMWGNSLTRLSNLEGAQQKYQRALEINPNSDTLFINLGTLAFQSKAYEEAERHFERALALNPKNSRASCGLGLIALEQDSFPLAQKFFLEAQRKEPGNKIAALQLAAIAHATRDFTVAILALEDCLKKHPTDVEVRYALAAIYFTEERFAPCESELNQVLKLEPSHERAGKLLASILEQKRNRLK